MSDILGQASTTTTIQSTVVGGAVGGVVSPPSAFGGPGEATGKGDVEDGEHAVLLRVWEEGVLWGKLE